MAPALCSFLSGSCFLMTTAAASAAQAVLTGVVGEDSSGRALAGVGVVVLGYAHARTTDLSGRFVLRDVAPGPQVVLFRLLGYDPAWRRLVVGDRDTARADAILALPRVQRLESIEVTERSLLSSGIDGFELRRELRRGRFLDAADLRDLEHLDLATVLQRYGQVQIHDAWIEREHRFERWAVSQRVRRLDRQPCAMQVILDRMPIYRPGSIGRRPPDLDRIQIVSLEAIEVYHSPVDTPVEFGGVGDGGHCGTLVFWSRRN